LIRFSVPFREALARLTLPVMLMISLCLVLVGRADEGLAVHLRNVLDDVLAPAYAVVAAPLEALAQGGGAVGHLFELEQQNVALRAENAKLLQWQAVALTLAAQNQAMQGALHYAPQPAPRFFTADVVADLGPVYARSVLVNLPAGQGPGEALGAIAMDGRGVAGRVVEAGSRAARVLLISDLNSRVPVALGTSGAPALMAGANDDTPVLSYWSPGQPPAEGAIVLTSAAGGAFPPGLPVGVVHYTAQNDPVVLPFANLEGLRLLRLFAYPVNTPAMEPVTALSRPVAAARLKPVARPSVAWLAGTRYRHGH
jgi:rod shape-determining protein MreC